MDLTTIEYGGSSWLWPSDDIKCRAALLGSEGLHALEYAISMCPQRRTAVQAGGNMGVWPSRLARDFNRVLTFEPDAINFHCLKENVHATNVEAVNGALGAKQGRGSLKRFANNAGAHTLIEGEDFPVIPLDPYNIADLDLLYLDVEGAEPLALSGGLNTVLSCRPVIGLEEKGQSERFGFPNGYCLKMLQDQGYVITAKILNDTILIPKELFSL